MLYKEGFTINGACQQLSQEHKSEGDYSNYTEAELQKLRLELEQIIKVLET